MCERVCVSGLVCVRVGWWSPCLSGIRCAMKCAMSAPRTVFAKHQFPGQSLPHILSSSQHACVFPVPLSVIAFLTPHLVGCRSSCCFLSHQRNRMGIPSWCTCFYLCVYLSVGLFIHLCVALTRLSMWYHKCVRVCVCVCVCVCVKFFEL